MCVREKYLQTLHCMLKGIYVALCRTFNTFMLSCQPDGCVCSLGKLFLVVCQMKAFKARWCIYSFVRGKKKFFFFFPSLFSKLRQSQQRGVQGCGGGGGGGVAQDLKTRICLIPYSEVMDGCVILYARARTSQHLSPPHPWAVEDIDQVLCDRLPQSSTSFSTCFCLFFPLPSALSEKAHHTHFHISFKSELCGFDEK